MNTDNTDANKSGEKDNGVAEPESELTPETADGTETEAEAGAETEAAAEAGTESTAPTPVAGGKKPRRRRPAPKKGKRAAKIIIITAIILLSLLLILTVFAGATLIRYYGLMNIETLPEDNGDTGDYTMDADELSRLLALDSNQPTSPEDTDPPAPETSSEITVPPEDITGNPAETLSPPETAAPDTSAPETTQPPVITQPEVPGTAQIITSGSDKVTNILLVGSDYVGRNGLSDIMVVVSINKTDKSIVMTSLMRDTYVYIPVNGGIYNKLNAAHSIGGMSLLIKTIRNNFGIVIDDYIRVKFDDAVTVFDYVGGLDITLTQAEIKSINESLTSEFQLPSGTVAGVVHLNGEQLRAYARDRHTGGGGDFTRTQRQRNVLNALFAKVKTMSMPQLNNLLTEIFPLVTTDISLNQFIVYIANSPAYLSYSLSQHRIPTDGYWEYYNNCVRITNMSATMKIWRQKVYG